MHVSSDDDPVSFEYLPRSQSVQPNTLMLRILRLRLSASTSVPFRMVIPNGALKSAMPDAPSRNPASPIPATVLTRLVTILIERTLWFPVSVTKAIDPSGVITTP